MSKEELISEIRGITNCSRNAFYEAVKAVGSNKENMLNYLKIHGCAVVTKDRLTGIPISSTAIIINGKDEEIEKLKAHNERLCQQVISINKENNKLREFREYILRVQAEPYKSWKENFDLQQQLKEKDEEIETIKAFLNRTTFTKEVTKQVCEKIRKFILSNENQHIDWNLKYVWVEDIKDFLDQIEKG